MTVRGMPARTDDTHTAIRDGLRQLGVRVHDTHEIGGGFPDLVCRHHEGPVVLLEVKTPGSRRRLTKAEAVFHREWAGVVFVVCDLAEAVAVVCG